jgi:microcystin-dependent protein
VSEPFLAEIRIVGFNFAPRGWALCDGQILPINQNQSLYSLLGTTYGGDGRTSFALPDLRGRVPVHVGGGHSLGQKSGEEGHALTVDEIPAHTHPAKGTSAQASEQRPSGELPADTEVNTYKANGPLVSMNLSTTNTGGGQGHNNMQPFLTLNFAIALQGLFPSR